MKKILLIFTLILALSIPNSYAVKGVDSEERGGFILILLANNNLYNFEDDEYICSYDGLYIAPIVYKKVYDLDITRSGDTWTVAKEGKVYGTFKHSDMFKIDETTETECAFTTDDKKDYVILEKVVDVVGESLTAYWEPVCDPITDTQEAKIINTYAEDNFKLNTKNLEPISTSLNKSNVGDLKAVNSYIKKMTKDIAKVNKANNTITYSDKSCSLIITLNSDLTMNVTMSGALTPTAYDIVGLAYNDALDKVASKLAITELKRLNNILANPKNATALKNIEKRPWIDWYYFDGTSINLKWSYDYAVVQNKKYIDFTITNFYLDTAFYYE